MSECETWPAVTEPTADAADTVTAATILAACIRHFDMFRNDLVPRCCVAGWEADLLVIRPSGWVDEVEIKVSLSDYRAEFREKAAKHTMLAEGRPLVVYELPEGGYKSYETAGVFAPDEPTLFRDGRSQYVRVPHCIRRFWLAMPDELARRLLPEIPESYGVLSVGGGSRRLLVVLRPAAALPHSRKLSPSEHIRALRSNSWRYLKGPILPDHVETR